MTCQTLLDLLKPIKPRQEDPNQPMNEGKQEQTEETEPQTRGPTTQPAKKQNIVKGSVCKQLLLDALDRDPPMPMVERLATSSVQVAKLQGPGSQPVEKQIPAGAVVDLVLIGQKMPFAERSKRE